MLAATGPGRSALDAGFCDRIGQLTHSRSERRVLGFELRGQTAGSRNVRLEFLEIVRDNTQQLA